MLRILVNGKTPWTRDQASNTNWQVYLQPEGVNQSLLPCPVRPVKNGNDFQAAGCWSFAPDGEAICDFDSQGKHSTNALYGDYAANFPLGGCWWPGTWQIPGLKLASVRAPAMVVYTTESGMAANDTTDSTLCIVPTCMIKYGAWVFWTTSPTTRILSTSAQPVQ